MLYCCKQIPLRKGEQDMPEYNFDEYIDRTGSNSIKHAFKKEYHVPEDVIPLWVAVTDFFG